ncbi:MAG TPA: EAL domain-containing protein [Gallionella sp.]|nr:EAL domain-containing protein [Gallionella sp.]HUW76620.1 EAL domain-containing protein [Gallionella sp.]
MQEIFLARQPIVDRSEGLVAFELLFRSANKTEAGIIDDTHATSQVIVNAFGEMGIAEVLGANKGFVNVDAMFLHSDLVQLLPQKNVVIELLETAKIDAALIARCSELKAEGYSIALDDVAEFNEEIKSLLRIVDIVKLDLMAIDPAHLPALVKELKRYPIKLLAEKVEDKAQARNCLEMGFDLFQGYHFARPEILSGKRAHPSKVALLRIFSLMVSGAENREIEDAFKEHADLAYNLMRIVNSVGSGLTAKISSLKHGLMVMGRGPLTRWVQLLLYASDKGNGTASPLMQLAATRGKLMELVVQQEYSGEHEYADRAFMVGVLSLLDALLGEALPEILGRINLQVDVEAALLHHKGDLGNLLGLCKKLEAGDYEFVRDTLRSHTSLSMNEFTRAQLDAMAWANSIVL